MGNTVIGIYELSRCLLAVIFRLIKCEKPSLTPNRIRPVNYSVRVMQNFKIEYLKLAFIVCAVIIPVVLLVLCLPLFCSQFHQIVSIKCFYFMLSFISSACNINNTKKIMIDITAKTSCSQIN